MPIAFIIALVVGVAGVYWLVLKNSSEKIGKQYALLAKRFDLEMNQPDPAMGGFIRPEPSLYGRSQGRELSVSAPGKGLQNTRQIETVLKLEIKNNRFAAQLTGAGLMGGLRQRDSRGMDRWKSGHEAFDAAVDVRTNDGRLLDRLLVEELQEAIVTILKRGKGSIYIGSGVIAYAELGLIAEDSARERFESVVDVFLSFADVVESSWT